MEYFEDYNFRPTQRSAKMGRFETGSDVNMLTDINRQLNGNYEMIRKFFGRVYLSNKNERHIK